MNISKKFWNCRWANGYMARAVEAGNQHRARKGEALIEALEHWLDNNGPPNIVGSVSAPLPLSLVSTNTATR